MSIAEIVSILAQHSCPDVTHMLKLERCGQQPIYGGGFGEIYQGEMEHHEGLIAMKYIRFYLRQDDDSSGKVLKHTARELHTWSRLRHHNIVELLGLAQYQGKLVMVSPWMANGTLLKHIERRREVDRYRLCLDIAEGVVYLHQNDVVHGDLKGGNVLICDQGVAKLTDFGCTKLNTGTLEFTTTTSGMRFSFRWTAPEILNGLSHVPDKPADIYALGMAETWQTFLEALTGDIPFAGRNDRAVYNAVLMQNEIPGRPGLFPSFSGDEPDQLWETMTQLWSHDPSNRPDSIFVRDLLLGFRTIGPAPSPPPSDHGPAPPPSDHGPPSPPPKDTHAKPQKQNSADPQKPITSLDSLVDLSPQSKAHNILESLHIGSARQAIDESNISNEDSKLAKGAAQGPKPESYAPLQDGTSGGLCLYFQVATNIYGYDILTHMIYRMDDQYSATLLELTTNPPLPYCTFTINNELFQMDWNMTLFRSVDGLWLKETLYESLADAFNIRKAIMRERDPNPLDRSMLALGSNLVEPATLSPLQPHWLRLGTIPSQNDIDTFIEAIERKQNPGDRPSLYCPLPDCNHPRELRRLRALRV
ncbi:Tyrosine kinase catalytic domain protein [Ceratobasidium sp. AG-Ba]|nr:Tyrosine kinase catalytic domain protein [Ceratobasidium sp. AG-Ba]